MTWESLLLPIIFISNLYRVSQKKWGFVLRVVLRGSGASNRKMSESRPPFKFKFDSSSQFGRVERWYEQWLKIGSDSFHWYSRIDNFEGLNNCSFNIILKSQSSQILIFKPMKYCNYHDKSYILSIQLIKIY